MRNELLKELKLEDLQGENRELAECIGMEAFIRLVEYVYLLRNRPLIYSTAGYTAHSRARQKDL